MKRFGFKPIEELMELFLPRQCCGCGKTLVGEEEDLCIGCLLHLPRTGYCEMEGNATEQRLMGRLRYEAGTSLLRFEDGNITQHIVHSIKYEGNVRLGRKMGRMMGEGLKKSGRFDEVECLIPIPLHFWRKYRRGYNQSEELCRGIGEVMQLPILTNVVTRVVNTESQTQKGPQERLENMQGAFAVKHGEAIAGKHVLLVDDVITTGATTTECGKVIEQIEGARISVASLAIAQ